jgi:predicted nucleotidyltransferase
MDAHPFEPTPDQRTALEAFCRKWNVAELSLFGSLARGEARLDSDADVLVSFIPTAKTSSVDMVHMEDELALIFQRPVDLLTRRGVESSRNPIRRAGILHSARHLISLS